MADVSAEASAIILKLAQMDPLVEESQGGRTNDCFFCTGTNWGGEELVHATFCIWQRAKNLAAIADQWAVRGG